MIELVLMAVLLQDIIPVFSGSGGAAACGVDLSGDASLEASWNMDQAAGSNRTDASGNSNDLVEQVGNVLQETTIKQEGSASADADGAGEWLEIADASLSTGFPSKNGASDPSGFTYGGWLYPDTPVGNDLVAQKGDSWDLRVLTTNDLSQCRMAVDAGGLVTAQGANNTVIADTWVFVVCIWNGTTLKQRVNGTDQADTEALATMRENATELSVFATAAGGNVFNGKLDDWAIFSRALSDSEADDWKDCGLDGAGLP